MPTGDKVRGRVLNRTEAADFFGVSLPSIDNWVRRGCAYVRRGARGVSWQFASADIADWLREQERVDAEPRDLEEIEYRHELAKTLKAELDLERAKGQVAYLDEVERAVADAFGVVRTQMRNIPARIAGRLAIESSDKTIKQLLIAEIDQALDTLADSDLVTLDDEP